MRLVLFICLFFNGVVSVVAQESQPITKRTRGLSEIPQVPQGLKVARFASSLGDISAMVGDVDASIYISDKIRGRIIKLTDRNKDGILDQSQPIANGFNSPSGLAVIGNYLYVADSEAIWTVPLNGGLKRAFVSLTNSQSTSDARPLLALLPRRSDEAGALVIGLNSSDGHGKLIKVDLSSRRGDILAESSDPILSLSRSGKSLWVGTPNAIAPIVGGAISMSEAYDLKAPVTALILPGQFTVTPEGFETLSEYMMVSLGHADRRGTMIQGSQVKIIPTKFGNTNGAAKSFVTGFTASGNRSAWGMPGAMWMDGRGLFLADSWSGTVWRISGDNAKEAKVEESQDALEDLEEAQSVTPTSTALPLIDGIEQTPASMLKTGSQIEKASRLKVGSTIVEKWEADQKAKKDVKKKEKQDD